MAKFLHELTNKREENARIDAMIFAQGMWDTREERREPEPVWQQVLLREMQQRWLPPEQERPF